ncbi:MAG: F0F1 ATP synthase subunit delta [Janthinobacterium lividum]
MAELATIARPYAEALFELARGGDLNAAAARLDALATLTQNPELLSLASSPKVSRGAVIDLVLSALDASGDAAFTNFVQMLVENHRLELGPQIAEQFNALKNAQEGAADVEIASAFPLEGAPLAELVQTLERKFGRKLKPHVTVDPSLIGGVCATVGDEVLDVSVRARLARMQTALTT